MNAFASQGLYLMSFFKPRFQGYKVFLCPVLFSLLTVSCAIQTEPTTLGERAARASVDKAALFGGQEEIIKPITLYEAIARAIKYNSDQKVALMEQVVAYGIADEASSIDLLPQLAASGGFSTRSNQLVVSADSVATGRQTLEESYIEDKSVRGAQLQVVYNVLDFGISYVKAKQASDKRYVSEEIRRKSVQQIVHEVRTAFWKAAAAQRIIEDIVCDTFSSYSPIYFSTIVMHPRWHFKSINWFSVYIHTYLVSVFYTINFELYFR